MEDIGLKQLIDNEPVGIEVEGFEEVLVRFPTIEDRLDVKVELVKLPGYKYLSEQERLTFEGYLIAIKALVKPKVDIDIFLKSADVKIMSLLEEVWDWYNEELKSLNDKREVRLKHFLQQKKENNQ